MKKFITIIIAIILMMPQEGVCLRPMATDLLRPVASAIVFDGDTYELPIGADAIQGVKPITTGKNYVHTNLLDIYELVWEFRKVLELLKDGRISLKDAQLWLRNDLLFIRNCCRNISENWTAGTEVIRLTSKLETVAYSCIFRDIKQIESAAEDMQRIVKEFKQITNTSTHKEPPLKIVKNLKEAMRAKDVDVRILPLGAWIYLVNPNYDRSKQRGKRRKLVFYTSLSHAKEMAKVLMLYIASGKIGMVKFGHSPEAVDFENTSFLVYCGAEDNEILQIIEDMGWHLRWQKWDWQTRLDLQLKRQLIVLFDTPISPIKAQRLLKEYPLERLKEIILAKEYLPACLRNDYVINLILNLIDVRRIRTIEHEVQRHVFYYLRLFPDVGLEIRYLVDREIQKRIKAKPVENDGLMLKTTAGIHRAA